MKIVFYGSGNMAHAIFAGIIASEVIDPNDIYITNRSNEAVLKGYADELGVNYSYDDAALLADADFVFLGTKPYDFEALADRIRPYITDKNRFISIIAGISIQYIRKQLDHDNPIARIMPNTNAQVGHSVTGISFSENYKQEDRKQVIDIVHAFGSEIEVQEDALHQVTAITGSGPAFLYHVFEQYVEAGVRLGLDKEEVEESIRNLIIGTGKMIERSDLSMEQLRQNVTSKGGTTQAGLDALAQHDIESIFEDCFNAAVKRSKELSNDE